jgi:filamentous hemagglutinin family protein
MKSMRRVAPFLACLIASLATAAVLTPTATPGIEAVTVAGERVSPTEFNGDMRRLPRAAADASRQKYSRPRRDGPNLRPPPLASVIASTAAPVTPGAGSAPMPAPLQNFPGISFNDACAGGRCGGGWPPDTNGDVGPNHYIQAVNQAFGIYSKSGATLAALTEDQLWSASGSSPCNGSSQGDPIVIYDAQADRWILTQIAFGTVAGNPVAPFYQCIAVSKSGDPVAGGWYFYALRVDPGGPGVPPVGAFNDYPKFGIWTDCLYMSANEFKFPGENFIGTMFASFKRSDLYAGLPLTWSLGFIANPDGPFTMIPANLSGRAAAHVPPGTPSYYVSESTTDFAYEVRTFVPGTTCGAGGLLSSPVAIKQESYDFNLANAPQPNTSTTLDTIGDRLMQKVQYRKVGSKESLWVVHNVQTGSGRLAQQWAQLDVTGGVIATTAVQGGTFAPDAILHRWMGSLAVDAQGNMALGYSTSNESAPNFPSIAYAGRLASDPPNQLPQSETQLVAGAGSQTNNCGSAPCDRWGDYTAMSVDPVDDCTFWYTNQYYSSQANGSAGNWQTRIGAFKFAACTAARPPSTTSVTSSANPAFAGAPVTFAAGVTGASPTGTVNFTDGGTSIAGCAAVALTGSGNTRTATCTTTSLPTGSHMIGADYSGDGGNAPSGASLTQATVGTTPGTATVVANPYGALTVQGATLNLDTITGFTGNAVIQLGPVAGLPGVGAEIDFQSLNLGPGNTLTIRSGAAGQSVYVVNVDSNPSNIAGTLLGQGFSFRPPVLYVKNRNGITVSAGGGIYSDGLGMDALGASWTVGQGIVNQGTIEGTTNLELVGARINGGGEFHGDDIIVRTFGSANNPVNGAFFLQNGLKLMPGHSSGTGTVRLTINAYGSAPQFLNFNILANAAVWMPSAWPSGSTVPQNQQAVMPGGVRAPGVPDPAYGAGSMIVQSSGSLSLVDGGTGDFVFPGGIVLKAGTAIDFNGVLVNQGWTTSGRSFQGLFFEAPTIGNSKGLIQLYSNNLNWSNFSTFPTAYVRAFTLQRNSSGSASFAAADATAPHINTYSVAINAAALGQCWTCLQNMQPVNMYGP